MRIGQFSDGVSGISGRSYHIFEAFTGLGVFPDEIPEEHMLKYYTSLYDVLYKKFK